MKTSASGIYKTQQDRGNILAVAEDLFTGNNACNDEEHHHNILKEYTPKNRWNLTVERVMSIMDSDPYGEFNSLKVDICIEQKMRERFFYFAMKMACMPLKDMSNTEAPI